MPSRSFLRFPHTLGVTSGNIFLLRPIIMRFSLEISAAGCLYWHQGMLNAYFTGQRANFENPLAAFECPIIIPAFVN